MHGVRLSGSGPLEIPSALEQNLSVKNSRHIPFTSHDASTLIHGNVPVIADSMTR
jgi:hypothetical protein